MGKITTITKAESKRIHQAVDAALKSVAEEFGLEFRPANGSFTSSDFCRRDMKAVTPRKPCM